MGEQMNEITSEVFSDNQNENLNENSDGMLDEDADETEEPFSEIEEDTIIPSDEQNLNIIENPIVWGAAILGFIIIVSIVIISLRLKKKPSENIQSETINSEKCKIANIQGMGKRQYQQDSFAITDISDTVKGVLAVVADGMGGVADGDVISRLCVQTAMKLFSQSSAEYLPDELLSRITAEAQREARAFIVSKGYEYSGSTLICVILKNNELYFSSVGDSRIALLRGGTLIQLNREHTNKINLDERAAKGEITFEEARGDKTKDSLISYIGIDGVMQRDYNHSAIMLQPGDRVILMSDGIFGTVDNTEIARIATIPDIQQAGAALEQAILQKEKPNQDNFTAIILEN